jgi:ketosteroid isomerase-like protein
MNSATPRAPSAKIEDMSAHNAELARQGFAAVLRGDLDEISELLDPGVQWHGGDPDAPGACHSRNEALAFMRRAARRRPMGELVDVVDAGDRVVVIIRPKGKGSEPVANVSTFRDGKVVEMVHYADVQQALAEARGE